MTKKFALALVSLMVFAAIAVGSASAGDYVKNISVGDDVFIGESGLNISASMDVLNGTANKLAWYSPGTSPITDAPTKTITVTDATDFAVTKGLFDGYEGSWYVYNTSNSPQTALAFYAYEPSLSLKVFNNATGTDITGKKVVTGDTVTFRIDSNLYSLFARTELSGTVLVGNQTAGVDIYVTTPDGATLTSLYNHTQDNSIEDIQPTAQEYYIINNDVNVDAWEFDIDKYRPGIYEVVAKCNVNSMKDNLGPVTGVTVSETGTIDFAKDTVSVTVDKETVIRNNEFSITVEGKPETYYYVWFSGTNSLNGATTANDLTTTDVPPIFKPFQSDVAYMTPANTSQNYKSATTVLSDVADNGTGAIGVSTYHGVLAETGASGTITIGAATHVNTKAQTYTIRAEKWDGAALDPQTYETVKVTVEKGSVTITASGDGSYYLGEQITLSGTNTDSDNVYMFITGPNLPSEGGQLTAPETAVTDNNASTFTDKAVDVDNTWEYKLETAQIGLDAGTYTIYAVNEPRDKDHLSGTKYDTVSVAVKKPFVTATVSASTVAKGDNLYIRGTAEGNPTQGVAIWILGKNYWNGADATIANSKVPTESVNDDGSFEYEFGSGDTTNLAPGQYFVVVQHPMYNDVFDVTTNAGATSVEVQEKSSGSINNQFIIWGGSDKLQGSDAAQALIEMIDSADIDDTYTKLTFLIEEPWVRINAIGDHYVGDQFTISGTTNLAVDDDLIVDVTSSSFTATKKSQSGEFSGKSETVKVVEGTTYNEWSMDLDASTFKADEYIVNVESIETSATATTTFNILAGEPPVTVTATETAPVVTTTATATSATPTETAAPGFGALVALIGLGAVAALVLRKE